MGGGSKSLGQCPKFNRFLIFQRSLKQLLYPIFKVLKPLLELFKHLLNQLEPQLKNYLNNLNHSLAHHSLSWAWHCSAPACFHLCCSPHTLSPDSIFRSWFSLTCRHLLVSCYTIFIQAEVGVILFVHDGDGLHWLGDMNHGSDWCKDVIDKISWGAIVFSLIPAGRSLHLLNLASS